MERGPKPKTTQPILYPRPTSPQPDPHLRARPSTRSRSGPLPAPRRALANRLGPHVSAPARRPRRPLSPLAVRPAADPWAPPASFFSLLPHLPRARNAPPRSSAEIHGEPPRQTRTPRQPAALQKEPEPLFLLPSCSRNPSHRLTTAPPEQSPTSPSPHLSATPLPSSSHAEDPQSLRGVSQSDPARAPPA